MDKIEFIDTQRKKKILIYKHYTYNKDKETKNGSSWRCRIRGCGGRILLKDEQIIKEIEHYHAEVKDEIHKLKIKNNIYNNSKLNQKETFEECLNVCFANNEHKEIKYFGNLKNVRTYYTRLKRQNEYINTENADDIFKTHKFTYDGNLFIQFDSGNKDDNRFVVFYTNSIINIIKNSKLFLCDSTFKICPKNFQQLFVLHTIYFNKRIPLIYILMEKKNKISYIKIFEYINKTFKISASQFITDFELPLVNSIKHVFKPMNVNGCLFHFGNIIWRRIQLMGYVRIYRQDFQYRKFIKKILLLAYVPTDDVKLAFSQITYNCDKIKHYDEIIFYFYKNFIEETNKSETKKIQFWNCYDRIMQSQPTTTNSLEAWHKNLNRGLTSKSISCCLSILRNEEKRTRILIDNLKYGQIKTKPYNNKQIYQICENYKHYSILEYIEVLYGIINFGFI